MDEIMLTKPKVMITAITCPARAISDELESEISIEREVNFILSKQCGRCILCCWRQHTEIRSKTPKTLALPPNSQVNVIQSKKQNNNSKTK